MAFQGVTVLDGLGPDGVKIHTDQERTITSSINKQAQFLKLLLTYLLYEK